MSGDGLRGRVVLVTGSGRGLGAAIARTAAAAGAGVVVHGRRDEKDVDSVVSEIEKAGGKALATHADITTFEEARGLVAQAIARWGRIDVLVNTVGVFGWKPLVEVEPPEWRRIVASNLDSVFYMCRLVVPHMRERHFGRIVSFSSVGAATQCEPQMGAYSAAKAGVIALSRALALEEAPTALKVGPAFPQVAAHSQMIAHSVLPPGH